MRYILLTVLFLMAFSCTKQVLTEPPLKYSFMPSPVDLDSINPIVDGDTSDVVDSTFTDFKSIPIDSGWLHTGTGDSIYAPGYGILISEYKAMLYPYYKSSWERYQKELNYAKYLLKEYYDKSKSAEILYQQEIIKWEKEARRTWLEKNMAYIGFFAGIMTMLMAQYTLMGITR